MDCLISKLWSRVRSSYKPCYPAKGTNIRISHFHFRLVSTVDWQILYVYIFRSAMTANGFLLWMTLIGWAKSVSFFKLPLKFLLPWRMTGRPSLSAMKMELTERPKYVTVELIYIHTYIIDQARGQDGWILASFSFSEWTSTSFRTSKIAWPRKVLLYRIKDTELKMIFLLLHFRAPKRKPVIFKGDVAFRFSCFVVLFRQRNHRKSFYSHEKYFL